MNHDRMIQNRDLSIFKQFLKSPDEFLNKCREIVGLIYSLNEKSKKFNKLSQNGKAKFLESLVIFDPYECMLGYAAGLSGCAEFAQRFAFITEDQGAGNAAFAFCWAFVAAEYTQCMNMYVEG